jgi:hypothetical protein
MSWKPVGEKDYIKYTCPKCSNKINSILGDKALYIVCKKCNNIFQNHLGALTFFAHFKRTLNAVFSIGTTGEYKGKKFQLIGIVEVKEDRTSYYWNEYIIKYEDETVASFIQYDGHWSYVERLPHSIKSTNRGDIFYEEKNYLYFNSYKTVHVAAEGEFLWNIIENEKPRVREYIYPPYGLVVEEKNTHVTWYKSEYITKSRLRTIFDGAKNTFLPYQSGVFSIQPVPFNFTTKLLREISFFYIVAILGALCTVLFMGNEQNVFDLQQDINPPSMVSYENLDSNQISALAHIQITDRGTYYPDSNVFVSEPFKILSAFNSTAVDVSLYAPVSNNWLEVSCQMINDNTGQEYFFENGVEYYYGSDWTEGSTQHTVTLSEIPNGTYRIIVKSFVDTYTSGQPTSYRLTVIEGVSLWSNFILVLFIGLCIPVGCMFYIYNFNESRWQNSNSAS